jgi:hypothetical protein
MNINVTTEVKKGKTYEATYTNDNAAEVYERLAQDLISKKLNECRWIKSIKRVQLYNGFVKIIVTYDNDCRNTYTIASH